MERPRIGVVVICARVLLPCVSSSIAIITALTENADEVRVMMPAYIPLVSDSEAALLM